MGEGEGAETGDWAWAKGKTTAKRATMATKTPNETLQTAISYVFEKKIEWERKLNYILKQIKKKATLVDCWWIHCIALFIAVSIFVPQCGVYTATIYRGPANPCGFPFLSNFPCNSKLFSGLNIIISSISILVTFILSAGSIWQLQWAFVIYEKKN